MIRKLLLTLFDLYFAPFQRIYTNFERKPSPKAKWAKTQEYRRRDFYHKIWQGEDAVDFNGVFFMFQNTLDSEWNQLRYKSPYLQQVIVWEAKRAILNGIGMLLLFWPILLTAMWLYSHTNITISWN